MYIKCSKSITHKKLNLTKIDTHTVTSLSRTTSIWIVYTSNKSLGLPTAAKRYCHRATSVFLVQEPIVSGYSANCFMNSTTRGRRASVWKVMWRVLWTVSTQTNIQTQTQTNTHTGIHTDIQTQSHMHPHACTDTQTDIHTDRPTHIHKHTDRHTDRQTDRYRDRQTHTWDRQSNRCLFF